VDDVLVCAVCGKPVGDVDSAMDGNDERYTMVEQPDGRWTTVHWRCFDQQEG
jgi:hypothetical protein